MKPGLHRPHITADNLGNLAQSQSFVLKKNNCFSLQRRQPGYRFLHLLRELLVQNPVKRLLSHGHWGFQRELIQRILSAGIPKVFQSQVPRSAVKVRSQPCSGCRKTIRPPNQTQKTIVSYVLGGFYRTQQPISKTEDRISMALVELLESRLIAAFCPFEQELV